MSTRVLVTGGAGFIGSNFVRHILRVHPDWEVINLDKLTYAGNLENLKDIQDNPRYSFVRGDITDRKLIGELFEPGFKTVVNFAAESHVDRSIMDPSPFIRTNIEGVQVLLEAAKQYGVGLFLQVSTDEVYGSAEAHEQFTEESLFLPNSPYAASKTAADCFCRAYYHTFDLPVVVTRCSNNYGHFQFPEKFLPLAITNALEDKEIPVYGDGLNVRDWIHVEDHCRALDLVVQKGKPGEAYNVGGGNERTNLDMLRSIFEILGKPHSLITYVADRLGHDRRYALDTTKINRELGFQPSVPLEEGLKSTAEWYVKNKSWWQSIKSGEYAEYYDKMYSRGR